MWRSSRSDHPLRLHDESRRCGPRGFTLLEAMVSLLLLVIVLIVAMTMLFQMRAFAERQQYFMLPRQVARRATDYLSNYFAGASDVNYVGGDPTHPSPNALVMYYNLGGVLTQASYNNVTDATLADVGTDIITMVAPFDAGRYLVHPNFPAPGKDVGLWLNFRVGCTVKPSVLVAGDPANQDAFKAATGFDGTQSALLMLVDKNGVWTYARITGYKTGGDCNDTDQFRNIEVTADTGPPATIPAPPNGAAKLTDPVYLVTGLQVISFRVLTDPADGIPKLQQKLGLFDPNIDNDPAKTTFTNVMENVEDLQIAYMYAQDAAKGAGTNGLVWNTASQTINSGAPGCAALPGPGCDAHIPFQAGPNFGVASPPLDISNVIGVRFSVTGRSPLLPLAAQKLTNVGVKNPVLSQHFRPASEDHLQADPPQYDQFDHYRATATLMLRSRIPRG
ncbi:MAG TPA: prepilin-type N-terminal cleavage/methylation domain-containing protein [Thermoanaerobaculia bacterium]